MHTNLRPSGIEGLGDMSWGTHFCLFYETKEDLLNILIPYFRTGLENHESCLWVTPQPLSPEEAKRTMREAGPEFERHLADGQIEIVSYMDWYLAEGRFDIQRVLQDWIDKHDQAIAKGYAGLRCTGNTFWLEKHQWDSFAKYEVEIDKVVSKLQIIVLCTYPLEHRSARDVLDVVHQHQFTVAKRNDVWEHLEGSELKRAHDEIRQLNADLEQRVIERTAQLAAANERLKLEIIERKQAEEETKHQAARAETLARIAARLNKQLDLNAVIHAVCEEAVNTFKVSQATMSLYDKKRDLLVYAGGVNIPPEYAASMEPITRSQFDDFLQEMGPIMVVPDIQSLPDVPNAEFSSHRDVRTVVTAAMFRDHELIGVLVVGVNGHVREFDQDELTLLKAISDQAAQAIANALLLKAANEQHEQLRDLSTKLVEVQETERQALTTELHDRVGQNLTGLSINLQNMKALLSDEMAKSLATKFDDAQALVEHTTRQIRDIMAELHPPELEDYGLAVALETYAERAASRGNLELIADLPDLALPPLPSDVRIALFRATQEAISNVLKHANATRLEISMEAQDGRIRLRVEDDGQGFELDAPSQKEAPSWGLKIMRERIESIGGNVHIESNLGAGTKVTFEIQRPS